MTRPEATVGREAGDDGAVHRGQQAGHDHPGRGGEQPQGEQRPEEPGQPTVTRWSRERSERMTLEWICDTRDSVTPRISPICASVMPSK